MSYNENMTVSAMSSDGTSSKDKVSSENTGLLCSRSRSQ